MSYATETIFFREFSQNFCGRKTKLAWVLRSGVSGSLETGAQLAISKRGAMETTDAGVGGRGPPEICLKLDP